jgi:hypothetical protein
MLWDMTISKSLDRFCNMGGVTGAWKTQITLSFTLAFTLAISASAQPNKKLPSVRGENLGEAGEEGRNYVLQLRLHHLLLLVIRISLGKTKDEAPATTIWNGASRAQSGPSATAR